MKMEIAQLPHLNREEARLLIIKKHILPLEYEDRKIADLHTFVKEGDVFVLNSTRVIPARLILYKRTGGGVQVLLVKECENTENKIRWECICNKMRGIRIGDTLFSDDKNLKCTVAKRTESKRWILDFEVEDFWGYIEKKGKMPLPPYIKRNYRNDNFDKIDREYYQTVFNKNGKSVAAPTAGLHFTENLFEKLKNTGVEIVFIRLDIGPATFLTVDELKKCDSKLEAEFFEIKKDGLEKIISAKKNGNRIIAVGTTVVRTLESLKFSELTLSDIEGYTDLFIKPPFKFNWVDVLITNFHLTNGTPILLTQAFAGTETLLQAYEKASTLGYKFYSYGDAMMIV